MSLTLFDLTGRRALVTGSSQGIGLALAGAWAGPAPALVLNGRDEAKLEAAAARLRARGLAASLAAFDVTDHEAVDAASPGSRPSRARSTSWSTMPGSSAARRSTTSRIATWHELMRTNLDSVFYVGQAVAQRMIPRGRGKIINIAACRARPRATPSRPTRRPRVR